MDSILFPGTQGLKVSHKIGNCCKSTIKIAGKGENPRTVAHSSTPSSTQYQLLYHRRFLQDLQKLQKREKSNYEKIYQVVFTEFLSLKRLEDLPKLHRLGQDQMFYHFTIGEYLIAIAVMGQIVKFLRILPKPKI